MARKSTELIQDEQLYHFEKNSKKYDRQPVDRSLLPLKEQIRLAELDKIQAKKISVEPVVKEDKIRFGNLEREAYEKNSKIIAEKEAKKGKGIRKRR